ncbi:efflux transporter, RND family, MFP subunit [Acididesulfobacillus acetoxydans]|uniref:Efflux transporter, RND family, MFP subunit n=1 Tax=Acididesulfobacillus acetoxydans TaxID=1561005 RepID=A0A8S0W1N3_9FIRM|nr:efflux transporter, RND family, MFP subunit [Acididesulfobacillus acetoxydans]CEJ06482.1 RND_mfp: efflux transporter, RND family, MFP subunit [Acididesulfobacillus acetoxydans]
MSSDVYNFGVTRSTRKKEVFTVFSLIFPKGLRRPGGPGARPRSRRGFALLGVVLLLGGTAGCGTAAKTAAKAAAVPVATEKVELTPLPTAESFLGTVTPYIQTVLSPSLSGVLRAVNVRTGDVVQAGQTLATIDTSALQAQKGQAAAEVGVAQAQLAAANQGSGDSLTQAAAAVKTAETNLANAKASADAAAAGGEQGVVSAQKAVEGAEKALATSRTQLANAQVQYDNSVKQAQAGVNQAQAALDAARVQAQTAANSLAGAQAAYDTAQTGLKRAEQMAHSTTDPNLLAAQAAFDQANIGLQGAQGAAANANAGVTRAQSALEAAQAAMQAAQAAKTVQTAQAQVAQAQAQVDQAQAGVAQAQAAQQNAQTSGSNGVAAAQAALNQQQTAYQTLLSNPQLQVSAAQVQAAQTGVQVIQAQIDNGSVVAPVGGYVTAVNAQVGQAVGPQGGFITIASMTPLQATVDVPEDLIAKMKVGEKMSVFVPATEESLQGSVSAVHPAPDPNSKKYSVDVALQAGKTQVLPGMQVEAHLVNEGKKGITVPADSVITLQSGAQSVFIVKSGKAKQIMIQLGAMTGSVYQVTGGLKVGDEVVVKGQTLLSDGDAVQVIPGNSAAGAQKKQPRASASAPEAAGANGSSGK